MVLQLGVGRGAVASHKTQNELLAKMLEWKRLRRAKTVIWGYRNDFNEDEVFWDVTVTPSRRNIPEELDLQHRNLFLGSYNKFM